MPIMERRAASFRDLAGPRLLPVQSEPMPRNRTAETFYLSLSILAAGLPAVAVADETAEATVPQAPGEEPAAPSAASPAAAPPSEAPAAPQAQEEASPAPSVRHSVARVVSAGRVGSGVLLPGGEEVLCLLPTVQIGGPIAVLLGNGHSSNAVITATHRDLQLAVLKLETRATAEAAPTLAESGPELGDPVRVVGHGGSLGGDDQSLEASKLASFSELWAHIAAIPAGSAGGPAAGFLLDRRAGPQDLGAPVFNSDGEVVGLVVELLDDAAGRTRALSTPELREFIAGKRSTRPYRRPHHLQTWGGTGIALHNRPSHLAALVTLGFRAVLFDRLRIEPWFEVDLGTRTALTDAETGDISRPRDFWWSLETGLHIGYRIPLHREGNRNYFVPLAGFRLGWNRFQHSVEEISSLCGKGGLNCEHSLERSLDRESSFRAGFELGMDLRHNAMRIGYRIFLDPTNLQAHSMHRLVLTFDGVPLPVQIGDSN